MRVSLGVVVLIATAVVTAGGVLAQLDLCTNIRLSISEQIECRARLTSPLNDGDRSRTQQEFEDRIRRANDRLITPPIIGGRDLVGAAPPDHTSPSELRPKEGGAPAMGREPSP